MAPVRCSLSLARYIVVYGKPFLNETFQVVAASYVFFGVNADGSPYVPGAEKNKRQQDGGWKLKLTKNGFEKYCSLF